MSRTRALLAVSLAVNLIAVVAFGIYVASVGVGPFLEKIGASEPEPVDYIEESAERFDGLPGARVVVLGDSLVQDGPFGEIIGKSSRRGIGGADIFDVTAMLPVGITPETRQVIVIAGTNDALVDAPSARVRSDAQALVVGIRQIAPSARVAWMAVPGPTGYAAEAEAVNAGIEQASEDTGFDYFTTDLTGPDGVIRPEFTTDGTHLNGAGYAAIADELRAALNQMAR